MEMMSLPKELIMECIARVPRCYYPRLSQVSKLYRSIVASPELYTKRSLLGSSECYIYVSMFNLPTKIRWYALDRANKCLVAIPSLPCMSLRSSLAVVGSIIYVMGGCGSQYESSVFLIDCPSNTWRLSGKTMPARPPLVAPHADVVEGKIYVVGGEGRVMVFDTEKQTWEELEMRPKMGKHTLCCVAISGKIYILTDKKSFVYEPKQGKWETDEVLDSKNWRHACVIDDVLYYYDTHTDKLEAYDSKDKSWKVVKGVQGLLQEGCWSWSCVTSHCGKLVLLLQKTACMQDKKRNLECRDSLGKASRWRDLG